MSKKIKIVEVREDEMHSWPDEILPYEAIGLELDPERIRFRYLMPCTDTLDIPRASWAEEFAEADPEKFAEMVASHVRTILATDAKAVAEAVRRQVLRHFGELPPYVPE
jgi:hypothetical protein